MDLWEDATALAARLRAGELSPVQAVDAAIGRIEAGNGELNAVIIERFDQARRDAAGQLPDGPFRGVPLLLKDLHCPSQGDPAYDGTRFLRDVGWVADHDSAVVRRFREAGFVIVGRTNVPELGTTITTEPWSFGPARNPWDRAYSTGGSSGGSAAAVAAGMVPVAHASDGGGSIRIPASACGLVGLKPSRARVSPAPDAGEGWNGASTNGAMTRTVRDAAAVLDALTGTEPGDPYRPPPLPGPLAGEVGRDPGPLRIGLLDHPLPADVGADPEAAAAVAGAGHLLEGLGHHVAQAWPAALDDVGFAHHFAVVVATATAAEVQGWSETLGRQVADEELEPRNALLAEVGRGLSASAYISTIAWLHAFTRRVAAWWEDGWDVLVTPVLNGPTPPIGALSDPEVGQDRMIDLLRYTSQWNITGQPAISLPLHRTPAGLPFGVQLVADAGREDLLVRLAAQLEVAAPWADRHPRP